MQRIVMGEASKNAIGILAPGPTLVPNLLDELQCKKKSDDHPDIAMQLYTKAIIDFDFYSHFVRRGRHRHDGGNIVALPPLGVAGR